MKLGQLLEGLKKLNFSGDETLNITDLAYHTGQVKPGCCFAAIRGLQTDGHHYIDEAVRKGAKAVLIERDISVPRGVSKIIVEDTRDCLGRLSALLFGEPTKSLRLVGITGTNGKTTIAYLIDSIWQAASYKSGLISTVAYRYGDQLKPAERTTPESYDLQQMFRQMVSKGVTDCVMEVTSHALDLKRVIGCHFDGAVFTNLSQDHLDYHKDMESYFAAKAKLFRERLVVSEKKSLWAVLNWDDPYGRTLAGGLPAKIWRYGVREKADVWASNPKASWDGLRLNVVSPQGNFPLSSSLIGSFNASNILAAVAASLAMEIPIDQISLGVASFKGVPGRLEKISNSKGIEIFVDYAHTPAALENVLNTLRALNPKKLITVFGCGGNRDKTKRPLMGAAASCLSDVAIVTSDNPRDEGPQAIINDILPGLKKNRESLMIVDRKEAISKALELAAPGDCVLIAGKGHETYQEARGVKKHFDDREVAKECLI
ncbi:MAG: UDP-N-acetylmuramoyl-L-alanyl-D-glutamate--2,6-diaminopimelate ligase [Deltaproteobacteria bacterium RIFCSPLOWO2_01_44_7]|nr:MAG: UDP-N-acetylmuramoyl-L-alanyl-D-glutamate--2,6-diaminopimelate ligase [Deltaproteobacteria bacterium RIFCSPHIGHO2_01_FULL_43_49]OGQ14314.1 MAG: UDP-N-acetylmuramoyl-L-alanyl-D-glutamate--2,6-diaminopimelate ligase [Deltaproteobacteria bacterium RIFCSPHIGHO2_02_FULL_44_53]OGQ27646.1 MAG: UDP-N-acetylmuramoyl-L-alanyl-D-glutamate--2,6-diaminopimelate ligase [Deltaproteobacteria bacterium RIFCSPHIGHO2_12_FULL_44_21]OGQ30755.1 MAG: UDP-N-acetylmuramoyl-L-alanyl-D-glutamate--2,6-diaminopimela